MESLLHPVPLFRVSPVTRNLYFRKGVLSTNPSLNPNRVSLKSFLSSTSIVNVALLEDAHQSGAGCDTKIRHFCDVGNLDKAMDILLVSPKSEIEVLTYCLLLQLCADRKSLSHGRKVHLVLVANGVEISGILGAKLVYMYVSCGDLKQARQVFNAVANDKVFLWNLMLNEYLKIGDYEECVMLFNRMRALNVEFNSHTFTSVFKLLGALGSEEGGEAVHVCALKMGLTSYNNVANALISFYFKVGRVESALKVFDELSDRDVVSWNSMISGCASNRVPEKGMYFFRQMLEAGITVDFATLISVLVACSDHGSIFLGRAAHSHVVKSGSGDLMVCNALLDMYSKCGDLDSAIRVFDKMSSKNIVSWTSMMAGFSREGLSSKAISLFHEMKTQGVKPDVYMITNVLHACALDGSLDSGRDVHSYIRENGFNTSLSVCNTLIDMYSKCGSMVEARAVFDELGTKRNIVSWNTLIGGYTKNGLSNEALDMFVKMQLVLNPDEFTFSCVLQACTSLAALEKGREIHGCILRNGYFSDIHVVNALIDMYVKCGALVLARSVFDLLPIKNLVSWTIMVAGYGIHGFGREAIDVFNQMLKTGIQPDEVSFMSILSACSHSGLLEEGYRFFNIMQHGCLIEAKLEHYGCIIEMLSRAGKLNEAIKFIKKMPLKPDAKIWSEVLSGCKVHHDVKLAEKVAEELFRLDPENTDYYVLLANVYAEAEKWEEVRKLTEKISKRASKKNLNPCCSWIEVSGKVEIFLPGDGDRHPQRANINKLLTEMRISMNQDKYPKIKYTLTDADELRNKAALCGHSEQLAIAFSVLNLPPGKTIRVTKTVRVCSECHEMAKFMSKMTNRDIILRDSNRFHHFRNGSCSCRGCLFKHFEHKLIVYREC